MLKFDSLIVRIDCSGKSVDSTMTRKEKAVGFQLDEVENTESILKKWNEDAANEPWEPYIVKAEDGGHNKEEE